jgi:hypothetical protein
VLEAADLVSEEPHVRVFEGAQAGEEQSVVEPVAADAMDGRRRLAREDPHRSKLVDSGDTVDVTAQPKLDLGIPERQHPP